MSSFPNIAEFLLPYEWQPLITLSCGLALVLYVRGWMRGAKPGFWRALAFLVGLGMIYVVTQTRFDYFSQYVFFIHRIQHLVLHHLAAMLLILSRPGEQLARGTPSSLRTGVLQPLWSHGAVQRTYRFIQHPVIAGFLFVGLIYFWLIPSIHFDAMLSRRLYNVMNWSMAVDGLLFWWLILNPYPPGERHRSLSFGKRMVLLGAIAPPQIVLGAYIFMAGSGLYDVYEVCGRAWPISPETDQHLGGLITWIPAAMMSALGAVIVLAMWLRHERGRTEHKDRGIAAGKATVRLIVIALTALLLGGCSDTPWQTKDISSLMPPLQFQLVNENGEAVTAADYEGRAKLLFFGFTSCPDICPTTLMRLSRIVEQLPEEQRDDVVILFVSVDPGRDSPERVGSYADAFGPNVVGLTGSQEQLRALNKRYRVTYGYDEPDEHGYYNVSHSAAVFGFSANGEAKVLIRDSDPPEAVLADVRRLADSV